MLNPFSFYKVFWQLFKADWLVNKGDLISKIIDITVWVSSVCAVSAYIFPSLGMSASYAVMMTTTMIISNATFDLFNGTSTLLADYD